MSVVPSVAGALTGAALTAAGTLLYKLGPTIFESGVDVCKLGWLATAASQLLCTETIDKQIREANRLAEYWSQPVLDALLAPRSKLVANGLLDSTEGRALAALVSAWLQLAPRDKLSRELQAFATAATKTTSASPLGDREVVACIVPHFADMHAKALTDIYDFLVISETVVRGDVRHDTRGNTYSVDIVGEIMAGIARVSRAEDEWLEIVNCDGIAAAVTAGAFVAGLHVKVAMNGQDVGSSGPDDARKDQGKKPSIRVIYETGAAEVGVRLCSRIGRETLYARSDAMEVDDDEGVDFDLEEQIRVSTVKATALSSLHHASEPEVAAALPQVFRNAWPTIRRFRSDRYSRNWLAHAVFRILEDLDGQLRRIDDMLPSQYLETVLGDTTGHLEERHGIEGSEGDDASEAESGADGAVSSLTELVFVSFLCQLLGQKAINLFVKPRIDTFFKLHEDLEISVASVFHQLGGMQDAPQDWSAGINYVYGSLCDVHRMGPYVLLPRCLRDLNLPDEFASLCVLETAVINLEGGLCRQVQYESPPIRSLPSASPVERGRAPLDYTRGSSLRGRCSNLVGLPPGRDGQRPPRPAPLRPNPAFAGRLDSRAAPSCRR